MPSPTWSVLFLSLLLLGLLSPLASAARHPRHLHRTSRAANQKNSHAERLQKSLNLSPTRSINKLLHPVPEEHSDASPRMVEKPIDFQALFGTVGPSIKEFGQYAGYYSLPDTVAARYMQRFRSHF